MKTKLSGIILLSMLLAISACSKNDSADTDAKAMDKSVAAVQDKRVEEKDTVMDAVEEEIETVVDQSSDETYVAGFLPAHLSSSRILKNVRA